MRRAPDERPARRVARPTRGAPASSAQLERMIEEDLDDVERALVYGDWLSSQGDPRGEVIAAQCAAEGLPRSSRQAKLAEALLDEHRAALLGPLSRLHGAGPRRAFRWRSGFIERARLDRRSARPTLSDLVRSFLQLPSARFVRHLTLGSAGHGSDRPGYGPTFEVLRELAPRTLRSLHVAEPATDVGDVGGLFEQPLALRRLTLSGRRLWLGRGAPPSLTELTIRFDDYGSVEGTLRGELSFPQVRRLHLDLSSVSDEVLRELRREQLPALEELSVVTGEAPQALKWPLLEQLRALHLDFAPDPEGSDATHLLASAGALRHLERLALPASCDVGAGGRAAFQSALPNLSLCERLEVDPFDQAPV